MILYSLDNQIPDKDLPFTFGKAVLHDKGFDVHGHDYSELVIITSGKGIHYTGHASYSVKGGDIFILHKGMKHGFSHCRHLEMFNIGFHPDFPTRDIFEKVEGVRALFDLEPQLRENGEYQSRFHASPVQMETLLILLDSMSKELEEKKEGFSFIFSNLFINLVIILGRFYNRSNSTPIKKMIRLSTCISQLEETFDKPFQLQALTQRNNYSSAHFIRSFKKIYGITPLQYVIQLRIEKAMSLLRQEVLNISEVAFSCGFDDSNYFSRLFRSKTGLSPRQYRKKINLERSGNII